ncbi:hypothetical protein QC763_115120 [Podospora pseudopauciseta]|uniref:Apple domain-containing protein n=1 Tax=Podospora pseudopauciseta TaxID=2093780 RepID=A0ABR0I0P7_9PEZI|nr:hypothetical protein QC763_115120 [Podospora pseudopauciseta]
MDIYRPSTRDSQRAFLQSQQQQPRYSHDRRVSQATSGATTAVQSQLSLTSPLYLDEKSVVEPPLPDPLRVQGSVNVPGTYPLATVNVAQRNGAQPGGFNWPSDGDLDPLPRYPGTPAAAPSTLAVPPIEREKKPRAPGTICGVRRGPFLLLSAVAGLVLLAIAVGVGVVVGLSKKPSDDEIAASLSSPKSSTTDHPLPNNLQTTIFLTATYTPTPTSTATSGTPSATPTGLGCPQSQGQHYTSNNNKKFITLCGVDYSDDGEAKNISNAKVKSLRDCLELCSKKKECTGAGWGVMERDKVGEHTCWMKNGLNSSHEARGGWAFGVLLGE